MAAPISQKQPRQPGRIDFAALSSMGTILARATLERHFLAPGTETRDLKIDGATEHEKQTTVGDCFCRPGARHALPSSSFSAARAADSISIRLRLSRHGFATLALAYFGMPPLPTWLHHIPLEYFEAALAWLHAQPEVDCATRGHSRRFARRGTRASARATISANPRRCRLRAQQRGVGRWRSRQSRRAKLSPCWTWRDKPIPFAPLAPARIYLRSAFPVAALKRPVMFRNLFRAGLRNRKPSRAPRFQSNRFKARSCSFPSGDDHLWPAAQMSEAIRRAPAAPQFHHIAAEHLHFRHAGHMLRYPHLPTTARDSRNKHLRNARFSFGGTAAADAEAQTSPGAAPSPSSTKVSDPAQ